MGVNFALVARFGVMLSGLLRCFDIIMTAVSVGKINIILLLSQAIDFKKKRPLPS